MSARFKRPLLISVKLGRIKTVWLCYKMAATRLHKRGHELIPETTMTACEVRAPSHDKLRTDIKIVEAHAEFYVFASIGHAGEPYAVAQSKLQRTLDTAKARFGEGEGAGESLFKL